MTIPTRTLLGVSLWSNARSRSFSTARRLARFASSPCVPAKGGICSGLSSDTFAHATSLPVYIDPDLLQYERIYAAAGVPECVFPLTPAELVRATGGQVVDVKEGEPR